MLHGGRALRVQRVVRDVVDRAHDPAVIAEIEDVDLTAGRRLQLACEKHGATGFVIQRRPFGGASRTRSGWGRIGGKYTLLDMTDLRTAVIDISKTRDGGIDGDNSNSHRKRVERLTR